MEIMEAKHIILSVVIGIVAGVIAGCKPAGKSIGMVMYILYGVAGSVVGVWLYRFFGLADITLPETIALSIFGAIGALWLYSILKK